MNISQTTTSLSADDQSACDPDRRDAEAEEVAKAFSAISDSQGMERYSEGNQQTEKFVEMAL